MLLRYVAWLGTLSVSAAIVMVPEKDAKDKKQDSGDAGQYFGGYPVTKLDDLRRFEYKDRPYRLKALLVKGNRRKSKSSRDDGGSLRGLIYRLHARKFPKNQDYGDYEAGESSSANRNSKTPDYRDYKDYDDYDEVVSRKSKQSSRDKDLDSDFSSKDRHFDSQDAEDYGFEIDSKDFGKLDSDKDFLNEDFDNKYSSPSMFDGKKGFGSRDTFGEKKGYGSRDTFGEKKGFGSRDTFAKSAFDSNKHFDSRKSFKGDNNNNHKSNGKYDGKSKHSGQDEYKSRNKYTQSDKSQERQYDGNKDYNYGSKYDSSDYGPNNSDYDAKDSYDNQDKKEPYEVKANIYEFDLTSGLEKNNMDKKKETKDKGNVIDHEFDFYSPIASSFDEEFKDISFEKNDFLNNKDGMFGDPDTDERSLPLSRRYNPFHFDSHSKSRRIFLERFKDRKPKGNLYIDFPPIRRHKKKHESMYQESFKRMRNSHYVNEKNRDSLYVNEKDDDDRRKDRKNREYLIRKERTDKEDIFDIYPRNKDKERRGYRLPFPGAFEKIYAGYHEDVKPTKDPFTELYVKENRNDRDSHKDDEYRYIPSEQSRKYGLSSKDIYEYERARADEDDRDFLHRKRHFFHPDYQNARYHGDDDDRDESEMNGSSEKNDREESQFYKDRDYYQKKEDPFGKYHSKHDHDPGFGPVGYKGTFPRDLYTEERFPTQEKNDGGFNQSEFPSRENYESGSYFGNSEDRARGRGPSRKKKKKPSTTHYCGKIDDSLCKGRNSGHYAHPKNNKCFIHCNNWGRAFVQRCPPGTAWTGTARKSPSKINLCV